MPRSSCGSAAFPRARRPARHQPGQPRLPAKARDQAVIPDRKDQRRNRKAKARRGGRRWNQEHFDAKAQHLEGLAANDKLELKTGDGEDRGGAVDSWRSAKEREIFYSAQNQAEYDAAIADLDNTQIDHAHELQLGGSDEHANMWAIDSATNHGMGGQINSQLTSVTNQLRAMGFSDAEITGTLIRINVVAYTP